MLCLLPPVELQPTQLGSLGLLRREEFAAHLQLCQVAGPKHNGFYCYIRETNVPTTGVQGPMSWSPEVALRVSGANHKLA